MLRRNDKSVISGHLLQNFSKEKLYLPVRSWATYLILRDDSGTEIWVSRTMVRKYFVEVSF